ncbi:MAG TPA: wax ester/triacylglycerol synthase family O-acyltransferase [Burkholderiaceae bacterium]|nr:wax ester/triacylglycerol synthase family O-acyltransferase [Burkholderiaceae bacterium]
MTTYPMTAVDAAWYHMDGPANLAMVTGLLLTKTPLDFQKVRALYKRRLSGFDRFRQRVVERGFPVPAPQWEDAPDFDMDQHVHHIALPAPHDQAALANLVSDIASTPLDHALPLWQVHVVDNVNGGSALVMRYHHCIADGTAMMMVIQQLFDTTPNGTAMTTRPRRMPRVNGGKTKGGQTKGAQTKGGALDRLLMPALDAVERSAKEALAAAGAALDAVTHPQEVIEKAGLVLAGAGMVVAELIKWPDPQSPFKGEFQIRKKVAWSKPVNIRDIKAIGAPAGAKVNDVLVAGMTGALRAYLKRRGVDVDHTTVRATVPVDLRPPDKMGQLGNEFGLVILDLPVTKARARDRLKATKERMDALKRSPEAIAMWALFDIFGRTPKPIEDLAIQVFGSKASVVMTNVVGPREKLYLAGTAIDRMMFWVPHPGEQLGMGISILSYEGKAALAVIADAHLVPDPEAITQQFNREFEQMLRRVKRAPAVTRRPPRNARDCSPRRAA